MSNSNTNLQTQSSNALHNAIMEAGSKDRPPMLALVNSSTIVSKIHHTRINGLRRQFQLLKVVLKQLQKGIDNDIYSTVDACPNACEMWKAIKRLKQACQKSVSCYKSSSECPVLTSTTTRIAKNELNEIRAERLARTANPLALVAQQQPVYHHQNRPTQNTQYSSTRSQQSTRNRGKPIVTSSAPTYDPEPATVTKDEEMSKEKEIDKLMALISLSFKKIYKPTNNNLRTSSNSSRANQDNSPRINRGTMYDNQRAVNVVGARENVEQADWKDDTDDESDNQELEAHYMYMAQIKEVTPDLVDNSGPNFDDEPMHKVQNNNDNYNVFAMENKLPEQPESSNDIYLTEQDLKKFQAELDKYNDVNYASKVEIDCAKAKGDLMSYKINFEKSSNAYTQKINDLNQTILDMKKELYAHQETISIMSQAKEAQIKLYKTREDKELDKVIALENKVMVLNDIVYKIGQSVQTINMLNRNCKMSFAKHEFLKKAQRSNPRLYDIGCYNDNLALMLAPESDETILLDKESRSKLIDLIRPFDYDQLNNLYDLFVPQWEKSAEQHYFPRTSKMSHTSSNSEFFKESFRK
ncbi:hypothetical protein Tco_0363316 [Tanacetum coccineum]